MIKSRRDLRRPVLRLGESYDMTRSSAMLPGRTPRIHQWCPRVSEGIAPLGAWPIPRKIGPGRPNVSSIVRKSGKRSPPAHVYCRSRREKAQISTAVPWIRALSRRLLQFLNALQDSRLRQQLGFQFRYRVCFQLSPPMQFRPWSARDLSAFLRVTRPPPSGTLNFGPWTHPRQPR